MNIIDLLSGILGKAGPAALGALGGGGAPGVSPSILRDLGGSPGGDAPTPALHPNDAPMTPEHAPGGSSPIADLLGQYMAPAPEQKPSGLQRIGNIMGLLGSGISQAVGDDPQAVSRFTQAQQKQASDGASTLQRQRLFQMARSLNLPPVQQLLFAADPEKWAETYGKRVNEYHAQAGGTTGYWGDPSQGGSQASAPLYGQESGEGYSATPDHMTDLGGLAQSPNQIADLALKQALEAERQRHEQEMERIAQQNANSNTVKADKYNTGHGKAAGPADASRYERIQ